MPPVNKDEIGWDESQHGKALFRRKQLGAAAGGEQLGCSLYELPPGRKSWPYHYHAANEEAIYVLSGTGSIRLNDGTHTLEEGTYVSLPTGESGSHRVFNDSETPLTYLTISTMNEPDITVYPDSEKFGVYVGSPPGKQGERTLDSD